MTVLSCDDRLENRVWLELHHTVEFSELDREPTNPANLFFNRTFAWQAHLMRARFARHRPVCAVIARFTPINIRKHWPFAGGISFATNQTQVAECAVALLCNKRKI